MELIQATPREADELLAFYEHVADTMEEKGLQHWHWGRYPTEEMIRGDIEKGDLYYLREGELLAGAVVLMTGQEPEYDSLKWTCGVRPGIFHRLAVHPSMQGAGFGGLIMDDVMQILRRAGCDCVRCDTADKNRNAIRLYEKLGFRPCDVIRWPDSVGDNITFDKPLKRETPLWPIPMVPAYRGGKDTPWGGSKLRDIFGKTPREERAGESMEVSCIPNLESRDRMGRTLPELVKEFGDKLIGACAEGSFPLLLKLIDVKENLSVQVHPNDTYAAARESGAMGKDEAWLILDTPADGGEVIYGVRPGVTTHALREACKEGGVEALLNRIRVFPGDVLYIPAGCIHAICGGTMLYEIQQSSDLTYRLWDWNRVDENGRGRELHLEKALDVADLKRSAVPVRVTKAFGVRRVLNEASFSLDVIRTDTMEILPPLNEFGILTVTEGELNLRFAGTSMKLRRGETCILPKTAPELAVEGVGAAALAMPNIN